jgi:glycerol uptake facilitator-like aquaporin
VKFKGDGAMTIFLAELIGTLLLILLGDGVVANELTTRLPAVHCFSFSRAAPLTPGLSFMSSP